jgi:hypothetical protein
MLKLRSFLTSLLLLYIGHYLHLIILELIVISPMQHIIADINYMIKGIIAYPMNEDPGTRKQLKSGTQYKKITTK